MALRATTSPGDIVAVESPAFFDVLQAIETLGRRALEIPVCAEPASTSTHLRISQFVLQQVQLEHEFVVQRLPEYHTMCLPHRAIRQDDPLDSLVCSVVEGLGAR